jgi:glycine/D-amino acid oxidase-like deaminating enzyme
MVQLDLHSGSAFWPLRDGIPASYPPLCVDLETDVVIVGAGVSGAMAACELARAGASVAVIDRRDVASGSSAASTGLLLYETDASVAEMAEVIGLAGAVRVYHLGLEAIDAIESICAGTCGFRRRPSVYLASRRRDVRALRAEFEARQSNDFEVEWLDRKAIREEYDFDAPAAIRAHGTAEVRLSASATPRDVRPRASPVRRLHRHPRRPD